MHQARIYCSTALLLVAATTTMADSLRPLLISPNDSGILQTDTTNSSFDFTNAFFQSLGTNGRSCATCHVAVDGWSITPTDIRLRFLLSGGKDPLFRTNDGSNCANADVSTPALANAAFSLLLNRGLIRYQLPIPANAEFTLEAVSDPLGCAAIPGQISVYRRVLPSTNLRFLSTVMWDGRESIAPGRQPITFATNPADLVADLSHQAVTATDTHAQASSHLTVQQQQQIVNFEMGLFTAQSVDWAAGPLQSGGALGGPDQLAATPFFIGINDPLGNNHTNAPFNPIVFALFQSWSGNNNATRASIARGEALFNTRNFRIANVPGLTEVNGPIVGTCGVCHDTPSVGNQSVPGVLNIGVALENPLGVSYLPMYTLRNVSTNALTVTTDPGRALITGKWADIGKFKVPGLRGLAARSPYFHNGSAATLDDVVNFYEIKFNFGLTAQEKADLVAFLKAL